jgi:hypothetical protein
MRQLKFFRWAAVLTLAIVLAPNDASAQEEGTLTISGTFSMGTLSGTVGPDLAEVFADGDDYTWTLTLHGTTQSHYYSFSLDTLWAFFDTEIHARSFDLEFFGPDAATLNGIVSEHIAGGTARITLSNIYTNGEVDFATMYVRVAGPDMALYSRQGLLGVNPLVPADVDGYPVVGPESFSIWPDYTDLEDWRPGNDGRIISSQTVVTFEGSVGELPGDFNHDDKVDAADLLKWQGDFSQNANSDADNDGDSDGADFLPWQRQLGAGVPTVAASADVPEPDAEALALLGLSSILLVRRRSLRRPNKVFAIQGRILRLNLFVYLPRGSRTSWHRSGHATVPTVLSTASSPTSLTASACSAPTARAGSSSTTAQKSLQPCARCAFPIPASHASLDRQAPLRFGRPEAWDGVKAPLPRANSRALLPRASPAPQPASATAQSPQACRRFTPLGSL